MNRPVITLLTDFGSTDHYVGALKGVILGICPDVQLVDITHEIAPYAITEAAFTIAQSWPCFPAGTIHLIVVDPGVGSSRRPILAEARGHVFVAPDNGVLTMVQKGTDTFKVREISAERFFRHPVSRTFHGRDIFAPVAARLATGLPATDFGPEIDDPVLLPVGKPVQTGPGMWIGTVLRIDRFGNVITNFECQAFREIGDRPCAVIAGNCSISQYYPDYTSSRPGEIFLIGGSSGFIEISLNQGDAAKIIGVEIGAQLELRF